MGLPTALLLARSGYTVNGFDIDKKKITTLKNGELPFKEQGLLDLFLEAKNNFFPDYTINRSDIFIITVPTPLNKDKKCELSHVKNAVDSVADHLNDGNLVALESTVSPGTTINFVKPILDQTKKKFYLSYVSEKAIPGNTINEMQFNHRIIGGINKESANLTKEIYSHFVKAPIHLTDSTTAEAVKLMENSFRDVNIALANELAIKLHNLNVNPWEAIKLANHHPRVNILQPGPGVGGHCIPIDPWFITDENYGLINISRKINDSMPTYLLDNLKKILIEKSNPKIAVFGVAYKANIDDTRESPSITFIEKSLKEDFQISIYDPHVKNCSLPLESLDNATKDADCILIITDHEIFKNLDPYTVGQNMRTKIILDTRNIIDQYKWEQAGFQYYLMFNLS